MNPKVTMPSSERAWIPENQFLRRLLAVAGMVGVLALALSVFLGSGNVTQFTYSYFVSWLFYATLALGGLFFVLVQFATRAGWSVTSRRVAEHVMSTLILLAVLALPILFGVEHIYPWAESEAAARDQLLQAKTPYLNPRFFYLRSLLYLLSWSIIAWWFRRRSLQQDQSAEPGLTRKLQRASAPALAWFGFTVTFAGFDWIMSLDPYWYSTLFGVYFFAGSVVGFLAFQILLLSFLQGGGALREWIKPDHYHDLGKLLFGFLVFWAYIAFSQFLLIWYANLPEETIWYAHRLSKGWVPVTLTLAVGHFVLPFFFLLSREIKRSRLKLAAAAGWLLAMHYVDLYWLVMPSLHRDGINPQLLDLITLLGIGGLFLCWLGFLLRRSALVPIRDPRLLESISFENV